MSKNNDDLKKLTETLRSEQKQVLFTNSRGLTVTLKALSPYLVQMATESIDRPTVPTYVVVTADGTEETHFHDEESIAQSSEEEKKKWTQYKDLLRASELKASEILLNVILMEGVQLEFEDEESWTKRQKIMGIPVSEEHEERLLAYKKQQVIGDTEDVENIIKTVMRLTGVSRDEVDLVEKSFPDNVEPGA